MIAYIDHIGKVTADDRKEVYPSAAKYTEIIVVQVSLMQALTSAEGFKAVLGDWDGMRLGQGICNYFHNTLHHLYKDREDRVKKWRYMFKLF